MIAVTNATPFSRPFNANVSRPSRLRELRRNSQFAIRARIAPDRVSHMSRPLTQPSQAQLHSTATQEFCEPQWSWTTACGSHLHRGAPAEPGQRRTPGVTERAASAADAATRGEGRTGGEALLVALEHLHGRLLLHLQLGYAHRQLLAVLLRLQLGLERRDLTAQRSAIVSFSAAFFSPALSSLSAAPTAVAAGARCL